MKMLVPSLHLIGVLLLFVGLGVESVAIGTLPPLAGASQAERWAKRGWRCQIAAAAVILASGAAMAARLDVFHFAWVNVSLVALVLIAALGGVVSRSRRRAAELPIGRLWPAWPRPASPWPSASPT